MLTFGQYNILAATRQRITHDQLTLQTEFNDLMVRYYLTGLLANGLITATDDGDAPRYELTDSGRSCLIDYERHNPELTVSRRFSQTSFR